MTAPRPLTSLALLAVVDEDVPAPARKGRRRAETPGADLSSSERAPLLVALAGGVIR